MIHHILVWLQAALLDYGYWTLAAVLLLENTGIPVPGETVLLLASFLAYSRHELQIGWIIGIGTIAATLGDNLGYAIGFYGGRALLNRYSNFFRVSPATLERGERLFARYGSATIFFARFVFGMRVIAGPLAGVLRMPWRRFALFNLIGAALWVSVIASVGFLFGSRSSQLQHFIKRFDLIGVAVFIAIVAGAWWRSRILRGRQTRASDQ